MRVAKPRRTYLLALEGHQKRAAANLYADRAWSSPRQKRGDRSPLRRYQRPPDLVGLQSSRCTREPHTSGNPKPGLTGKPANLAQLVVESLRGSNALSRFVRKPLQR